MTKIKICGLTREADISCVNELKPDYIGFVFFDRSRRFVSPERAAALKKMLDPQIKAVGVFVNAPAEQIEKLVNDGIIDMVQLHGNEDEEFIRGIKERIPVPVMKAFRIDGKEDIERALISEADHILLDNGAGGTGEAFDWSFLSAIDRPYFLAGGLSAENVRQAVERYAPYGVDTSSGVETDGIKDFRKIKEFIETVRFGCTGSR